MVMTDEVAEFDKFYASALVRIDKATMTDEVQQILREAKVYIAMARAAKNREYEEIGKTVEARGYERLGMLMAAQRDAGLLKVGRPKNGSTTGPILKDAGISKRDADKARKAYPEGWPIKPKAPKTEAARKIIRARIEAGEPLRQDTVTIDGISPQHLRRAAEYEQGRLDGRAELQERIAELETENARLKSDLEALQTGNIMRMSQAAMLQRKEIAEKLKTKREARKAVETMPDEKTKEAFERQIQNLKTQLRTEKSKILALTINGKVILDKRSYKGILVCLHPDGAIDPAEKARREKAFKSFTSVVPEPEF